MDPTPEDVARLLREIRSGNRSALDTLVPAVYRELRAIAAGFLSRERNEHTLQPTALVHEAYLRLAGQNDLHWESRAHFLGIAARVMRQVLVDHARRRLVAKREGGLMRVTFDDERCGDDRADLEVVALHEALDALAQKDERLARVVELRYFGGLSVAEAAEVLGVGTATVERDWRAARAWLLHELTAPGARR
jgi:RNA polymerase sigma factor (TIGR02999 family)